MINVIVYSSNGNGFSGHTLESEAQISTQITSDESHYILKDDESFLDFYVENGQLKKKDQEYHLNLKRKYFHGKLTFTKSMTNKEVDKAILDYFGESINTNKWKKENYSYIRGFFYPPESELYDGMAKANSTDPTIKQEGERQMQSYFAECLGVKKRFPKP